ncbi:MAG: SanA/YdcF family protein [Dermatophilaceae bacterium]
MTARPAPRGPQRSWLGLAARLRRPRRPALVGGLAVALVIGLGPWAWTRVASAGHVHRPADAPSAPVVLVLGAGLDDAGRPNPYLAARLDVAAQLLENGRARVALVSGDNRFVDYDEPTAMLDGLVERGVPASAIVRDFAGRDTYDSCVRARRIFGVDRVLVVSQAYHLSRAVAICRAVGLDAEGVGDWSAQRYGAEWAQGTVREVPASVKAAFDVLSRRDPVLGPAEPGVQDALDASSPR